MYMMSEVQSLISLVESEDSQSEDFAAAKLPQSMRALTIHRSDMDMFKGLEFEEKDPSKSLNCEEVALPPLGPFDVMVAMMASAINFNTVWSSIFEPIPSFRFLEHFASFNELNAHHNQDYHILGSDGAGVVLRVGSAVTGWKPGDRVVITPAVLDYSSHQAYDDALLDPHLKAWGFETNFGGLAEFSVVRESQLLPKPEHLTWEEAASMMLVSGTTYRMLISRNGGQMKLGDNVLIWGAAGGLGSIAIQYVKAGGGFPIGVVSSPQKAEVARKLGCEAVIDRRAEGYQFIDENGKINTPDLRRFKKKIREFTGGEDPDIVYEHTGRFTFAASLFVAKTGGKIVTSGSTTGYEHMYDNRYLWMNVKSIIGSHTANYKESWEANRLACKGRLHPVLSEVFPLSEADRAAKLVHKGQHVGKLGILCLAPEEGLGIRNHGLRETIGEDTLNVLRGFSPGQG